MKKLVAGIFVVVLLLILATSVASADQPPGVDSADRSRTFCASTNPQGQILYGGYGVRLLSNSASGHMTTKCKMEHVSGPPIYGIQEFVGGDGCRLRIVFAGESAMFMKQGFNCQLK